ncbi:MAG: fumarylacetoacetate hydrolase family protein [Chloroflexi bacterium]|nr:fumarylacetoacetate hydrolase family protein [Chloroflexota bacterium]
MIPDLALCRFQHGDDLPRLGLIADDRLYDLTALESPDYATLEGWLLSASGQVEEALDKLEGIPKRAPALCSVRRLLDEKAEPHLVAPIDTQEVWACGVTYEMSREARKRESEEPTVYGRVYDAPRPEVFFKATPHRVVGPGEAVAIRADSNWDVPESELTLLLTPNKEIVGFTVGNDMSSRNIEGENPLYLPQAKIYNRCCALGPVVRLVGRLDPLKLAVRCVIYREGKVAFEGETNTSKMHRPLSDMVEYLGRCNSFPTGVFMLTGTGVVPPDDFTLQSGDVVEITIEKLGTLRNPVIEMSIF